MDTVIIEGLQLQAVVGVFEWERQIKQPLWLDLVLSVDTHLAASTDDLVHAVNYQHVSERVIAVIQQRQAKLIETLADLVAQTILQEFHLVHSVRVTIRKPLAVTQTSAVGVSIERSRDDLRACTGH
ncbi:MAG: dihydroneopterin aldolase [Pseudomonadota bacterium]|nr:dihydroneopterin aldolase [Pseudomonadota bacterium]